MRGLCECISSRLKEDTLASIPMTSTGYVRRELRINVKSNKKNREAFINSRLDPHQYELCREAFRGGDTHANSARANQINLNAWSYDIKSSYPTAIMEFEGYPFSAFESLAFYAYIIPYCLWKINKNICEIINNLLTFIAFDKKFRSKNKGIFICY